ncbi:hypothetical protein GCM10009651_20260 [Microbacterium natoriense]
MDITRATGIRLATHGMAPREKSHENPDACVGRISEHLVAVRVRLTAASELLTEENRQYT